MKISIVLAFILVALGAGGAGLVLGHSTADTSNGTIRVETKTVQVVPHACTDAIASAATALDGEDEIVERLLRAFGAFDDGNYDLGNKEAAEAGDQVEDVKSSKKDFTDLTDTCRKAAGLAR